MVPRLNAAGKSFKGLALYLTHDSGAGTAERVAWTHTLNCAFDHIPSAVDELVTTWRDVELLKQEAGVRRGGRVLEAPVKHVSLNWHPSERPSREAMIDAAESFLVHMGWHEHQAVLVAHTDKLHAHVHLMLNAVHPETGCKLDDGLEKRRAQAWAKAWELEHGVFCPQRLRPTDEREPSPPRWLWEEMQVFDVHRDQAEAATRQAHIRDLSDVAPAPGSPNAEWRVLKAEQRREREAFHAEGKQAYSDLRRSITREVRESYRGEWGDYYAARRQGTPPNMLDPWRTGILARQKAELTERREKACVGLRETRDEVYAELMARQRVEKQELRERQRQGEPSVDLIDLVRERVARFGPAANQNEREDAAGHVGGEDRDAAGTADERTDGRENGRDRTDEPQEAAGPAQARHMRNGADIVGRVGLGVMGGLATFGERLFEGLFGGPPPRRRAPAPPAIRPVPPPANDAGEAAQRAAEVEAEDARRRAAWWEDRQREHTRD